MEKETKSKVDLLYSQLEEDCEVERCRLEETQKSKINEIYDKRMKQLQIQQHINSSHILNDARLRVLREQQNVMESIRKKVMSSMPKLTEELQRKLFLQALLQLASYNGPLLVRCRKNDIELTKELLLQVKEERKRYLENVEDVPDDNPMKIDEKTFLPESCGGGVHLFTKQSRMKCCNTLEDRLALIFEHEIPFMRLQLFGENPHRKHMD
ncbi:hypothetical protein SNEBB_004192 [Seison nebaliae]|nr:hypothetical protein SNEBB_004192 [Seison nebaliae]